MKKIQCSHELSAICSCFIEFLINFKLHSWILERGLLITDPFVVRKTNYFYIKKIWKADFFLDEEILSIPLCYFLPFAHLIPNFECDDSLGFGLPDDTSEAAFLQNSNDDLYTRKPSVITFTKSQSITHLHLSLIKHGGTRFRLLLYHCSYLSISSGRFHNQVARFWHCWTLANAKSLEVKFVLDSVKRVCYDWYRQDELFRVTRDHEEWRNVFLIYPGNVSYEVNINAGHDERFRQRISNLLTLKCFCCRKSCNSEY